MRLLDDFIKYVKIDTQSDEESTLTPSTLKQYDLLKLLKSQLDELGIENELDEYGRVYAHIPGNTKYDVVGLCAHVDTALECSGANVNPQIIENYDGGDIKLGTSGLVLSPKEFPRLKEQVGNTIVTTDGTTLLGSDDKAGLAIIMEVARNVLKLPVNERRPMSILFTPDEEVGRGPEHFNPIKYNCAYAYTIDGESPRYISYENFNARAVSIDIVGKSIHPGSAKGIMVNASMVLNELISMLPSEEVPSKTEKYEGFHHLTNMNGGVENAHADFILRNHDASILDRQTKDFYDVVESLSKKYPSAKIEIKVRDQYRNMREIIDKNPKVLEMIESIYNKLGVEFEYEPIRGGTDGATFSFNGVPCPNIGTGGYNCHGRYEYLVLEEMMLMAEIGLNIYKIS
ncbi:MAG: peptidase T [Bacilli bacterium]|nr:peptidase T [Bacilli bacterium]